MDRHLAGDIPLDQLTASAQGWANHARYGNTLGLRKAVFGSIIIPGRQSGPDKVQRYGNEERCS